MTKAFSVTWSAANTLYQVDNARRLQAEGVFGNYLQANPNYTALSGYAVIALTPARLQSQLAQISQEDFPKSKKLKLLRKAISGAAAGPGVTGPSRPIPVIRISTTAVALATGPLASE